LHLRFLCPSKKSSKSMLRCKSDPSSAPYSSNTVPEEERRFYLYNDLRVVFPQRHSDADEGEVHKTFNVVEVFTFSFVPSIISQKSGQFSWLDKMHTCLI
jgi:hypothetical protein